MPMNELQTEMEDAIEALLKCARWQLREGVDCHPELKSVVHRARKVLDKASRHPRADDRAEAA
jgi:hypothetical protein